MSISELDRLRTSLDASVEVQLKLAAEIERLCVALRRIVAEAESDDGLTAWDGADIAREALRGGQQAPRYRSQCLEIGEPRLELERLRAIVRQHARELDEETRVPDHDDDDDQLPSAPAASTSA